MFKGKPIMKKLNIKPKHIFNFLVIGLCVGIVLYFFFSKDGLNDLLHSETEVIWYWVAFALLAELVFMFFETLLIYIFIKDDYPKFKFSEAVKVSLMGLFWCAVTPSSTGGQPMQVYLMHSMGISVGYSTSRLMQKFMVYQVILTTINIASVAFNFTTILNMENAVQILVLLGFGFFTQIGVTVVMLMFSFKPTLSRKLIMALAKLLHKIRIIKNVDEKVAVIDEQLDNFHTSNRDIYRKPKLLAPAALFTVLELFFMFLVTYFIYLALETPFSNGGEMYGPIKVITSQAYVNLISGMVPIPGASGASELCFTTILGLFFAHGTLKSAALIWRFINYYGVVFFTAPFAYFTKGKVEEAKEKEKQEQLTKEK